MSAAVVEVRPDTSVNDDPASQTVSIPWYLGCGVVGITSSVIGIWWDLCWHSSVGRDGFWTPPHVAIYLCGVLVSITCGYLILAATFGRLAEAKAASVQVLGFRGPFGAFIAAWGGIAMITSAPFDNWWHAAYGLDSQVITPPHCLLFLGMRCVELGVLTLILATMNRAADQGQGSSAFAALQRLLLFVGGLIVTDQMLLVSIFTYRFFLHSALGYLVTSVLILPLLALMSQISRSRWSATAATGVYTILLLAFLYIMPLFPAHPRLGPVYTEVTHLVPPSFPLLILLPAIALDLFWQRAARLKVPVLALASAAIFTFALVAVEWPFADFLLSKQAENRIFGTMYYSFRVRPSDKIAVFSNPQHGLVLLVGLAKAVLLSAIASWIAFSFGRWMKGIQR